MDRRSTEHQTGRVQAVPSISSSSRQKQLFLQSFRSHDQLGLQLNEKSISSAPSPARFMEAAGAYLTNEHPQVQQSRPSDVQTSATVDLRPSNAVAPPSSVKAVHLEGRAAVSGSVNMPAPPGAPHASAPDGLQNRLLSTPEMASLPFVSHLYAPGPAAPSAKARLAVNTHPGHMPPLLPHTSRPAAPPNRTSFPSGLSLPPPLEGLASRLARPVQPLHHRLSLQQYLSPCQSAPANALQMFNSAASGRRGLAVSHSAPTTIPAAWRQRPEPHGHSPSRSRQPRPSEPPAAPTHDIAASLCTSGNTSGTTWPSLDRESIGTASWCPSGLSILTQDFQELVTMYLGLVRELERIGLGVSQEPGVSKPAMVVHDAAALRAFANGADGAARTAHAAGAEERVGKWCATPTHCRAAQRAPGAASLDLLQHLRQTPPPVSGHWRGNWPAVSDCQTGTHVFALAWQWLLGNGHCVQQASTAPSSVAPCRSETPLRCAVPDLFLCCFVFPCVCFHVSVHLQVIAEK